MADGKVLLEVVVEGKNVKVVQREVEQVTNAVNENTSAQQRNSKANRQSASSQQDNARASAQNASATRGAADATNRASKEHAHYDRALKGVHQGNLSGSKSFSKMRDAIDGGSSGLVAAYATLAANMFAATAAFTAFQKAAQVQQLTEGLSALGTASGIAMISLSKGLQQATGYSVSLQDSMRSVSMITSAGFDPSVVERLGKVAKNTSIALGRDMQDSMNRLVKGAVKLEPELLDELGIMVRIDEASQMYAQSLGKNASQLTNFEKRQAFMNAVLTEGEKKFGAIGDAVGTNPYDRLAANLSELSTSVLQVFSTILNPIVNFLNQSKVLLFAFLFSISKGLIGAAIPALGQMAKRTADLATRSEQLADLERKNAQDRVDGAKKSVQSITQEENANKRLTGTAALKRAAVAEGSKAQLASIKELTAAEEKLKKQVQTPGPKTADQNARLNLIERTKKALEQQLNAEKNLANLKPTSSAKSAFLNSAATRFQSVGEDRSLSNYWNQIKGLRQDSLKFKEEVKGMGGQFTYLGRVLSSGIPTLNTWSSSLSNGSGLFKIFGTVASTVSDKLLNFAIKTDIASTSLKTSASTAGVASTVYTSAGGAVGWLSNKLFQLSLSTQSVSTSMQNTATSVANGGTGAGTSASRFTLLSEILTRLGYVTESAARGLNNIGLTTTTSSTGVNTLSTKLFDLAIKAENAQIAIMGYVSSTRLGSIASQALGAAVQGTANSLGWLAKKADLIKAGMTTLATGAKMGGLAMFEFMGTAGQVLMGIMMLYQGLKYLRDTFGSKASIQYAKNLQEAKQRSEELKKSSQELNIALAGQSASITTATQKYDAQANIINQLSDQYYKLRSSSKEAGISNQENIRLLDEQIRSNILLKREFAALSIKLQERRRGSQANNQEDARSIDSFDSLSGYINHYGLTVEEATKVSEEFLKVARHKALALQNINKSAEDATKAFADYQNSFKNTTQYSVYLEKLEEIKKATESALNPKDLGVESAVNSQEALIARLTGMKDEEINFYGEKFKNLRESVLLANQEIEKISAQQTKITNYKTRDQARKDALKQEFRQMDTLETFATNIIPNMWLGMQKQAAAGAVAVQSVLGDNVFGRNAANLMASTLQPLAAAAETYSQIFGEGARQREEINVLLAQYGQEQISINESQAEYDKKAKAANIAAEAAKRGFIEKGQKLTQEMLDQLEIQINITNQLERSALAVENSKNTLDSLKKVAEIYGYVSVSNSAEMEKTQKELFNNEIAHIQYKIEENNRFIEKNKNNEILQNQFMSRNVALEAEKAAKQAERIAYEHRAAKRQAELNLKNYQYEADHQLEILKFLDERSKFATQELDAQKTAAELAAQIQNLKAGGTEELSAIQQQKIFKDQSQKRKEAIDKELSIKLRIFEIETTINRMKMEVLNEEILAKKLESEERKRELEKLASQAAPNSTAASNFTSQAIEAGNVAIRLGNMSTELLGIINDTAFIGRQRSLFIREANNNKARLVLEELKNENSVKKERLQSIINYREAEISLLKVRLDFEEKLSEIRMSILDDEKTATENTLKIENLRNKGINSADLTATQSANLEIKYQEQRKILIEEEYNRKKEIIGLENELLKAQLELQRFDLKEKLNSAITTATQQGNDNEVTRLQKVLSSVDPTINAILSRSSELALRTTEQAGANYRAQMSEATLAQVEAFEAAYGWMDNNILSWKAVATAIGNTFERTLQQSKDISVEIADAFTNSVNAAVDGFVDALVEGKNIFKAIGDGFRNTLRDAFAEAAKNKLKEGIAAIFEGLKLGDLFKTPEQKAAEDTANSSKATAESSGKSTTALQNIEKNLGDPKATWDCIKTATETTIPTAVNELKTSIDTSVVSGLTTLNDTLVNVINTTLNTINTTLGSILAKPCCESSSQPVTDQIFTENFINALKAAFPGQPVPAAATGGMISGPGGPRDDRIPAMLSNGEFVVNAKATQENLKLLQAINSGNLPGFAEGVFLNRRNYQLAKERLWTKADSSEVWKELTPAFLSQLASQALSTVDSELFQVAANELEALGLLGIIKDPMYKANFWEWAGQYVVKSWELSAAGKAFTSATLSKEAIAAVAAKLGARALGPVMWAISAWQFGQGVGNWLNENTAIQSYIADWLDSQAAKGQMSMKAIAPGAMPLGKATGGMISGPGGPKDDKIPAMLSNGEFVVNAASTKKYLSLLQAINSGNIPKFKDGTFEGNTVAGNYSTTRRITPDGLMKSIQPSSGSDLGEKYIKSSRFFYDEQIKASENIGNYVNKADESINLWGKIQKFATDNLGDIMTNGLLGVASAISSGRSAKKAFGGAVLGSLGGAVGAALGSFLGPGGAVFGERIGAALGGGIANREFAMGGVMTSSGPLPLEKYAKGGIANSPQLALYGEGRKPEAYVPLPDGRSIPVSMNGSGGNVNNISVNVSVAGGQAQTQTSAGGKDTTEEQSRKLGVAISNAVKQEIFNQQRPGGLLYKGRK